MGTPFFIDWKLEGGKCTPGREKRVSRQTLPIYPTTPVRERLRDSRDNFFSDSLLFVLLNYDMTLVIFFVVEECRA